MISRRFHSITSSARKRNEARRSCCRSSELDVIWLPETVAREAEWIVDSLYGDEVHTSKVVHNMRRNLDGYRLSITAFLISFSRTSSREQAIRLRVEGHIDQVYRGGRACSDVATKCDETVRLPDLRATHYLEVIDAGKRSRLSRDPCQRPLETWQSVGLSFKFIGVVPRPTRSGRRRRGGRYEVAD